MSKVQIEAMPSFTLPAGYPRIKRVGDFQELLNARFGDGVNALCWERKLKGDFEEVAKRRGVGRGITALEEQHLRELSKSLSGAGRAAIEVMLEDLQRLRERDLLPELNAVNGYVQREQTGPVRTDVCSFHVDSATAETDTWLCTYHGASSEGLRNDEAVRKVDVAEIRAELMRSYREDIEDPGATDDEAFREWLNDNCYDLHYAPLPGAQPFSFGVGNLWRISTQWPEAAVPPCIHRAPDEHSRPEGVRLLLIS
jgi:hypothetical protein